MDRWLSTSMLTLHSSKSCKAGLRSRSSHVQVHTKYIPVQYSTYYVHTKYILVCISTQYLLLRTYSVQGCASGIPRLVALQSCNLVKLGVQTLCILCMAECFNGTYSSIVQNHLELYVPGTYLLVMLFTILRDFLFLPLYLVHPDLHCANYSADLDVPSTKARTRKILRIVKSITRRYVQLQSSTRRFRTIDEYVPLQHCAN
jgi:hypothetical protein